MILASGKLEDIVADGLKCLSNLKTVVLSGSICYESPFCRSWPSTYLFRRKWHGDWKEVDNWDWGKDHNRMSNYCHSIFVRALSKSGLKLSKLIAGEPEDDFYIPSPLFTVDNRTDYGISTVLCMLDSYSALRTLSFALEPNFPEETRQDRKWLSLQLPNLMTLNLCGDPHDQISYDTFESWFCPKLRNLSPQAMEVDKDQVVGILERHSSLQTFTMGETATLHWGSWPSILESMRKLATKPKYIALEPLDFWSCSDITS